MIDDNVLTSLEKDRIRCKTNSNIYLIIFVIFLTSGIVFGILGTQFEELSNIFYFLCAIFTTSSFGLIMQFAHILKKFEKKFFTTLTEVYAKEYYEETVYFEDLKVGENYIKDSHFFRSFNKYDGSKYFRGTCKGVNFISSNYVLTNESSNDSGNNFSDVIGRGKFIVFELKRDLKTEIMSIEKSFSRAYSGYKCEENIEFESVLFNEKFHTSCSDKLKAFYVYTPQFIETLLKMEEVLKGTIMFYIKSDKIYLAIDNYEPVFHYSIKNKITKEYVEIYRRQIGTYKAIIDNLNLDSSKFTDVSRDNM